MRKNTTTLTKDSLIFLLLFFLLFAFTGLFAQPYQIGHKQITFQDPARSNRSIQTEIYYPANTAGDNVAVAAGTYPVIVFGHGFVMAWDAYTNIWSEIVPRGYIMVFPRTEGSIIGTDHQKFGWDLQFLVNRMQQEGTTSGSIFFNKIAVETALMGHSMGGGAAFLAADSLCGNGNVNLKTLIGLAPAESSTNGVSSITSATRVTVPSVVFSGSNDGVTPAADHHTPMYNNLASSCKTFINILGGGHCYYANTNFNCDFGESTSSTGISITRAQQQDITYDFVNLWLDYTLKGDCNAFNEFQDSLNTSVRISHLQACVTNPVPVITASGYVLTSSQTGTSYQWFLNGAPIANSNSVSITATQNGNYTVEVTYANGCPETSLPYNVNTVGIDGYGFNQFNIYPNPTKGLITVKGVNLINENVQIYNTVGQLVVDYKIENSSTINLSNLSEGVYIIKINAITKRIIVSK